MEAIGICMATYLLPEIYKDFGGGAIKKMTYGFSDGFSFDLS